MLLERCGGGVEREVVVFDGVDGICGGDFGRVLCGRHGGSFGRKDKVLRRVVGGAIVGFVVLLRSFGMFYTGTWASYDFWMFGLGFTAQSTGPS